MIQGFWGRKVGMTQVFVGDNKVVPVTAVDASGWFVTQVKTQDNDGYNAIQVAYPRSKYQNESFQKEWLQKKSTYFRWVKEIAVSQLPEDIQLGQQFDFSTVVQEKENVDVVGTSKGCGFSGAMRKHNFSGGPKSHGSAFHRRLGGVGFMRATGQVIKNKGMAGHFGVERTTVKNLQVVQVLPKDNLVLIQGSMAGKSGSLVYIRRCG